MDLVTAIKQLFRDVVLFCEHASGLTLRSYQEEVALAVADSIIHRKGLTFVVLFPRQSGKNELQAQLQTYLLSVYSNFDAEIVQVAPSWKPQSQNAMRRLERVLSRNLIVRGLQWQKEQGYIFKVGRARIYFMSGAPTANVVGATASTLLSCDEAQDVTISKWDKEFNPMAASTNATRVFWGTAWTSTTLLAREKKVALRAQAKDKTQRVFQITADQVREQVPQYGLFVDGEIKKLGRNHPMIKTQFFSEEIDAESGMFPDQRLALMQGAHTSQDAPKTGQIYVFTIDVAGQDEAASLEPGAQLTNAQRDSSTLTIFEVDTVTLEDPLINAPTYRVVGRYQWTGAKHSTVYASVRSLIEIWQPFRVVVDATGIGEPLASLLSDAYPAIVLPFKFTQKSKSDLGWAFLGVVETGRFKDHKNSTHLKIEFISQCTHSEMDIKEGPNKIMMWSVPGGTRDHLTGDLVHDDLLVSAALVSLIDDETLGIAKSDVIQVEDPLEDLSF